MAAREFVRNHWPAITIGVTAAAIALAAIVMLGNMPPRMILMATGPEGGASGRPHRALPIFEQGSRTKRSKRPSEGSTANRCDLDRSEGQLGSKK